MLRKGEGVDYYFSAVPKDFRRKIYRIVEEIRIKIGSQPG